MAFEYQYSVYNPGQYPGEVQKQWDALVADGWQVHTAVPNYSEISILWHRELPDEDDRKPGGRRRPAQDKKDA